MRLDKVGRRLRFKAERTHSESYLSRIGPGVRSEIVEGRIFRRTQPTVSNRLHQFHSLESPPFGPSVAFASPVSWPFNHTFDPYFALWIFRMVTSGTFDNHSVPCVSFEQIQLTRNGLTVKTWA